MKTMEGSLTGLPHFADLAQIYRRILLKYFGENSFSPTEVGGGLGEP